MAWLAGLLGWLQIPTSQLLIAVPFLLIGLSVDYALHVIMRYREARAGRSRSVAGSPGSPRRVTAGRRRELRVARGVRTGMVLGLGGSSSRSRWPRSRRASASSNVVSPLPAIRDFAILAAGHLRDVRRVRRLRPGAQSGSRPPARASIRPQPREAGLRVTPGPINRALSSGVVFARRAPLAVVVVALLLAVGGAYGATGIDTEFNEADFLPRTHPTGRSRCPARSRRTPTRSRTTPSTSPTTSRIPTHRRRY